MTTQSAGAVLWDQPAAIWAAVCPHWLILRLNSCNTQLFSVFSFEQLESAVSDALTEMHQNTAHPGWIHWGLQKNIIKLKITTQWNALRMNGEDPGLLTLQVSGFRIMVVMGLDATQDSRRFLEFEIPMWASL